MIQAGSATQPVIGKDAVNLTLTPTTNLNAQVGSKDGPLVEVKPSLSIAQGAISSQIGSKDHPLVENQTVLNINMGELGPSIEKSVMYALLGLLLIVIVKELFSHFLAKRRNRA